MLKRETKIHSEYRSFYVPNILYLLFRPPEEFFLPNIRHFMFRTSRIFRSEHLNCFHSEHQEKPYHALWSIRNICLVYQMFGRVRPKRDAPIRTIVHYPFILSLF
jgi:hypothetical protein